MTDPIQPDQPVSRRRLGPVTALAAASLAGLVLGLGGVANAQTAESPAPTPSTSAEEGGDDALCDKSESTADGAASSSDA